MHAPTNVQPPSLRRPRSAAWLWQAAFIFGPLLVLAGLGGWGIRESRTAAKRNALRAVEASVPALEQLVRDEEVQLRNSTEPLAVFIPSVPAGGERSAGAALFERVLEAKIEDAGALLAEIEREHGDEFSPAGVPLMPLVQWTRLKMSRADDSAQTADTLAVSAVRTHPSFLTPMLLERAEMLLDERGCSATKIREWRAVAAEHERARAVWNAGPHGKYAGKQDEWLPLMSPAWYFAVAGNGSMRAYSPERLGAGAAHIALRAQALLPGFFALDVGNGATGKSLLAMSPPGERFFERRPGLFSIAVALRDPAGLYAQQKQQALWMSGLLVAALAAAAAGYVALRRSLARERQLSEMKSNFVSSVSHELRAPLASMRLMAENLESGVVSEPDRRAEYHHLIAEECRRLGALVNNVLDFARIEQGRKTYHFAETDVPALVADTVRLLEPRAHARGQKFSVEVEPLFVRCDGAAIQQALVNLLDNALKFSPQNSTVSIRAKKRGAREWELSVSDEGPGVPEGERDRIFERFYRVGSELTRETQGAGIGLSIVKHIAEGHGGRVEVEGATFRILGKEEKSCLES